MFSTLLIIASAPPSTAKDNKAQDKHKSKLKTEKNNCIHFSTIPENSALIALYSLGISRIESPKFERFIDDGEKEEVNENDYLSWSLYL